MASTFGPEFSPKFDPASGLSDEAREAVNAAFEAMAAWRAETVKNSEQCLEKVMVRMAEAARALGWPDQVVEATCGQIQALSKMQIQMIDKLMDAWAEQIKTASPPSVMLSKLRSFSNVDSAGVWPGVDPAQIAAMNPLLVSLQIMEQWQKTWADAAASWPKPPST